MDFVMIGLGVVAVAIAVALVMLNRADASETRSRSAPRQVPRKAQPAGSINRRANWLEGVEGKIKGKTYHVGSRQGTIGRKVGNYIQVTDDKISRVHLQFSGSSRGVEVTDKKTNLGTKVNGEALVAGVPQLLADGDRLEIGEHVFVFHAQADFPNNHGLTDQKVAGADQMKRTAAMGAVNWKKEVLDALAQAEGDEQKAAEIMGTTPEIFKKMLEQARQP